MTATRVRPPNVTVRRARRPAGQRSNMLGLGSRWSSQGRDDSVFAWWLEPIADASNGVDVRGAVRIRLDLLTKRPNVDVQRPLVAIEPWPPYGVEEIPTWESHAGAFGEQEQQVELPRREVDRLAGHCRCAAVPVDPEL